jgi:hypothetical protein
MRFSDLISKNESHISQAMEEGGVKNELAEILKTQRPSSVYVISNSITAYHYVSSMLPAINVVKDNERSEYLQKHGDMWAEPTFCGH